LQAPGIVAQFSESPKSEGRSELIDNTVDFAAANFPPTQQEMSTSEDLLAMPFAAQAIVAAVTIPGVDAATEVNLSGPVLAEILLGNCTHWNE
jgi:ABC-type phosphate transport system substrate-binding protein